MNRRQFIVSGLVAGSYVSLEMSRLGPIVSQIPSEPIGLGIIGAGHRGLLRLDECFANPGAHLKAVCDIDDAKLANVFSRVRKNRRLQSCQLTRQATDIFRNPQIRAVSIAVPGAARAELIKQACEAGKQVLVEAPWATSIKESQKILELAAGSRELVHQTAYDPDWDDHFIRAYLQAAQQDVTSVRLSILAGADPSRTQRSVLYSGFDILGATTSWLGAESAVSVSAISGGVDGASRKSVALRVDFDGSGHKHLVMAVTTNPRFAVGQVEAQVQSRSKNGQLGRFVMRTENLNELDESAKRTGISRFLDLASAPREQSVHRARRTHELNSFLFMAETSMRNGRSLAVGT